MWLVNCSNYRLEPNDVDGPESKSYWILSHTWGDEEVTYQDMQNLALARQKRGFQKIEAMCRLAPSKGTNHVWIDTCCIDKTSSAELSESINSMFYWYRRAARCVAYLEDLEPDIGIPTVLTEAHLENCRWFTRGWTLQELLAPSEIDFYDRCWSFRGFKTSLSRTLSNITEIHISILQDIFGTTIEEKLQKVSVATKMSWAAGRKTTRLEDKAYCLLGIFDVQMPLLYGEREQAFTRLQQEIAQKGNDMSLFAWIAAPRDVLIRGAVFMPLTGGQEYSGLLASDPSQFSSGTEVVQIDDPILPPPSWTLTNAGLEMATSLDHPANSNYTILTRDDNNTTSRERCHAVHRQCYRLFLHCRTSDQHELNSSSKPGWAWDLPSLAIWLRKTGSGFVRYKPTELCSVRMSAMKFNDLTHIRISTSLTPSLWWECMSSFPLYDSPGLISPTVGVGWNIASRDAQFDYTYHPAHLWDRGRLSIQDSQSLTAKSFTMGLVKMTISNQFGSEPFSQTCWVCCGMVFNTFAAAPWVDLVLEDANGFVAILGQLCDGRALTNPFALASLQSKLRMQNIRPESRALSKDCLVRCTPTLQLSLRASEFTALSAGGGLQETNLVTITADRTD